MKNKNDKENEKKERHVSYTVSRPKKDYIPEGCAACGGPYPLCKGGCPAFDDEE